MKQTIVRAAGALLLLTVLAASTEAISLDSMSGKLGVGGTVAGDHMWLVKLGLTRRLAMEIGFDWTYDSESDGVDRLWLGGGLFWHSWQGQRVRPYVGGKAAIEVYDAPGRDESTFILMPSAGVEYFFSDALSLGAEASLPIAFGSFSLRTTTLAAVRYYF